MVRPQWAGRSPATWNVCLDAVRSAAALLAAAGLDRRRPVADARAPQAAAATGPGRCPAPTSSSCSPARTSPCASGRSGGCCTRPRRGRPRSSRLTSRTWTCPTAAPRSGARAARSTSIVWQTGTARLLPRLLKGRKSGPVFVTERKARVQLPAADLDQLRPGPAELPAGRGAVLQGLRRRDAAPAAALRADPRRRGRHRDADADGPLRPHLGPVAGQVRQGQRRGAARHQAERTRRDAVKEHLTGGEVAARSR